MAKLKTTTIYGDLLVTGTTNLTANISTAGDFTATGDLYGASIYIEEDANSSYYLRLYNNSGLTANKTLTINTNNADRTISLSGNLTVSAAATVSGTNTGDVTLATNHGLSLTNQVIGMGTPSTLTGTTTNSVTTTTHSHAITGAALTKTDDTNVTLTLGGSSSTALLNAASLTLGWTGQLSAARGGTGIGSYAVGDIIYASGSTTLSKLADIATGNALISGGVTTAPSWGKIGLTTHISGTLAVGNGGTGATTLTSTGILTGNGTSAISAPGPTLSATTMTFGGAGTINSTSTNALTLDSTTTGAINLGTNANAKIITIGNTTGATSVVVNSGTNGVTFNQVAAGIFKIQASAVPTTDMVQITNSGYANATAGVNALNITYVGGAAAVESSAIRAEMTPGGTSGGTWSSIRVINGASVTGVVTNGVKFDTKTAGAGTANVLWVGTGWDNILNYNGTTVINGTGNVTAGQLTGTIPSAVLGNSTVYIGTTGVALNRSSAALTLAGLTLTTPNIGAATATTVNGLTITSVSSKTLNLSAASLTVGTATTNTGTVTLQSAGTSATTITGPNGGTATLSAGTMAITGGKLSQFAATTSAELAGVISDETGSGALVFATSPSLTTPSLGVATATSINKVTITAPTTSATLTLVTGSSLITAGAFALTLTSSNTTNATFPAGTITLMDLGTAQSVTGAKTYNSSALKMKGSSTGTTTIASANSSTYSYTLTMPAVSGNFAVATSSTGSIMVPAGATANRDGSPTAGYFRFNTTTVKFEGHNGTDWGSVGGGATGAGTDEIFIENGQTVTNSYTITTNKNAGTFGPVTINTGVTVTVPTGSVWTVV